MENYVFAQIFKSFGVMTVRLLDNIVSQGNTAKMLILLASACAAGIALGAGVITVIFAVKRKKLRRTFAARKEAAERTDREFDEILKTLEAKMLNSDEKKEEKE